MFRWYKDAYVCYAYLEDVPGDCPALDGDFTHPRQMGWVETLEASKWFTRGWTLQELIAPKRLYFYGHAWNRIGSRANMTRRVSGITNIQEDILDRSDQHPDADIETRLESVSVARRLSWAASRKTTRLEDHAYSLLGLLNVNMPLLYGEGKKSFLRLQEEIIKQSTDQSIFAWNSPDGFVQPEELLFAPSPACFRNAGRIGRRRFTQNESSFRISNKGLEISLPIVRRQLSEDPTQPTVTLGILDCKYDGSSEVPALVMNQHPYGISNATLALELYVSGYKRDLDGKLQHSRLISVQRKDVEDAQPTQLTITKDLQSLTYIQASSTNEATWFPLWFTGGDPARLPVLRDVYPDHCWSESSKTMKLRVERSQYGAAVVETQDGVSVLICFGLEVPRARNIAPEKKLFGMCFIDSECSIKPHLDSTMRKYGGRGNREELRLSRRESLVASLWRGALNVCVENAGGSAGSITGLPSTSSPMASPVLSAPTSPQLYNRRPSSSHSRQGSFRRDSFLNGPHGQFRKDSVVQDDASSTSSQDPASRVVRLKTCPHCKVVKETERAEKAAREQAEQDRATAAETARKKRERNAKAIDGVKKASMAVSAADILWEFAEGFEFLA